MLTLYFCKQDTSQNRKLLIYALKVRMVTRSFCWVIRLSIQVYYVGIWGLAVDMTSFFADIFWMMLDLWWIYSANEYYNEKLKVERSGVI